MHRNSQHVNPGAMSLIHAQAEAQARQQAEAQAQQAAISSLLNDTHRRIYIDQLRQQDLINCVSEEQQQEICEVAFKFSHMATQIFGLGIGVLKRKE